MKALRLIAYCLNLIFILNAVALLLCILCPFIPPWRFTLPAVAGLGFKYFLLVHLGLTVFYVLNKFKRWRWRAFVIFFLIIPLIAVSFAFKPSSIPSKYKIKVLSYNIKNSAWGPDLVNPERVFKNITVEKPDIVSVQEYFKNELEDRIISKMDSAGLHFHYYCQIEEMDQLSGMGLAIYSRYPIINHMAIIFPHYAGNGAFLADIKIGNDTLRFINVHYQSVELQPQEYESSSEPGKFKINENAIRKIMRACRLRGVQATIVEHYIQQSPYKTVLTGDFNDTPVSYTYFRMTRHLDDSFLHSCLGIGSTFINIPFLRIDYILCSPEIHSLYFKVVKKYGSDHFPVIAYLSW